MGLLRELSGHPEYVRLLNLAKEQRPVIPPWDLNSPIGVDDWKHKSAMQQGFDLCLQIFTPK